MAGFAAAAKSQNADKADATKEKLAHAQTGSQGIIINNVVRIACKKRHENVGVDIGADKVHRTVAESKISAANMKTVDFFVVVAVKETVAATVVNHIPVFAIRPTAGARGFSC